MKRSLQTFSPLTEEVSTFEEAGVSARLSHISGDPESVYRLYIQRADCSIELCPSKGLSVRDTTLSGQQIFWDAPLPNLPNPAKIDLAGEMVIGGTSMPGFTWVAYFAAHVEMLGLRNWGLVSKTPEGELLCLHGNASMIPIENLTVELSNGGAVIEGSFFIRDANSCWPPSDLPPLFKITKRIELLPNRDTLLLTDTIENVSDKTLFPDWGYHVQLRPEPGCRFTIPSESVLPRGGDILPDDYQLWYEAPNPPKREERGFIHKGVRYEARFPDGSPGCETLLTYPDGSGICCLLPPSPYVMSWFSCGGADDDEFLWPDGSKWLHRNWDGVGPEIGASSLDHDGDVDTGIKVTQLEPGEITVLNILIEPFLETNRGNGFEQKFSIKEQLYE